MRIATAFMVWAGLAATGGADVTLYSQPAATEITSVGLGFYTSTIPRVTRNYKHADDFTIPGGGTIQTVRWWGLSEGLWFKNLGNFDRFAIEFYRSANGPEGITVGELLLTADFAIEDTHPTETGRKNRRNQSLEYRHEVTLPKAFIAEPGVTYFIAIAAHPKDTKRDAWCWQDGSFVNGASQNWSWASESWSSFQDTDSSFELVGAVPAPGVAPAMLVFALAARRRRG